MNIKPIVLITFSFILSSCHAQKSMDDVEKQIQKLKLSYHFFELEEKIKIIEEQNQNNIQAQILIADWSHFIMDFEKADSLYAAVLKRDSTNIAAINGRALIALDNDQVERSLELMKKAIKIDSKHSISWVNYSKVLLEIRNSEGVITSLNKAIECDSLNAEAYARKGFYYAALRYDIIEGAKYFNKAIEINPYNKKAHHYLGRGYSPSNYNDDKPLSDKTLIKVDSLLTINQFESAHVLISNRCSENSNSLQSLKLNAACEFHVGNYRKTIKCAFKILELKPNYGLAHYFIAESLNQLEYEHNILMKKFLGEYEKKQAPATNPFLEDVFINYHKCDSGLQKIIRINTAPFSGFLEALAHSDATVYFMDFHHLMFECPHLADKRGTRAVDFRLADDIKGQGGYHMNSNKLQQNKVAYGMFNVAFHEFGHLIQWLFTYEQNTEIMRLYTKSRIEKHTLDWYADMNMQEYFAQGVEAYLSEQKLPGQSNTTNNTRQELYKKDLDLYKFIESLLHQESYQKHIVQGLIVKSWYTNSDEDALTILENALAKYPYNSELLIELGILYREKSDFKNAKELHSQVTQLFPTNLQAHLELSYDFFLEGENKRKATEILLSLKHDKKFDAKMYRFLGYYYTEMAEYTKAIMNFEITIKMEPFPDPYEISLPDVFFLLAKAQLKIEDFQSAENNLMKSLDINRGRGETYAELAFVNQQLNKRKQATNYLQTAMQLDPTNKRILEIEKILKGQE
ncbi:MAG: hypothetical protein HN704_04885 [Bacteroidetes bacterium]|nr:hypothetical protein [Bacteroidota bacterium]MBT7143540.1 hypothetical protein [Bacteroidota bacterium]MBT7490927.1 hypothetical protein [Bacteroidota bacterium]